MPADKGVRPHMSIIADADTLADAAQAAAETDPSKPTSSGSETGGRPSTMAGYGSVGPKLLGYLACLADYTPILTRKGFPTGQAQILNVGRVHRSPTLKQRRAVLARQDGVCAAPGCSHTHLEIHHTIWWSKGGPTDLDLLIGLCVRCHHLLHRGMLNIRGNATTGFTFTNQDNRPLLAAYRHRRNAYREDYEIRRTAATVKRNRDTRLRT